MSGFTGSLQLENFRNHERKTIDLNLKTLVIGKNGSGKTSILEALSLLSVATSWKTERDGEVILHGQDFTRIVLGEHQVFLQRSPALKKYRVDGQSKKLQEVLGILPTVLFQPDDAQLVHGSPAYRRATIDRLLSQVVPGYAGGLSVLQKVLKQRNRLLKIAQETGVTEEEFLFWEEQLSSAADLLYRARKDFVGVVGDLVQQEVGVLMQELPILAMVYHQSPGNMTGSLQEHYKKNRYKEIAAGVTLYGPHREDVQFTIGGYPADEIASRGQARAIVLGYKIAEMKYVESHSGVRPTLLVDDIFAEFDAERRERVLGLLREYDCVIAVTDVQGIPESFLKEFVIIQL